MSSENIKDPGHDLIDAIADHVTVCRHIRDRLEQFASALSMTGAQQMALELRQIAEVLPRQAVEIQRTHSRALHNDLAQSEAMVGKLFIAAFEGCLVPKGTPA